MIEIITALNSLTMPGAVVLVAVLVALAFMFKVVAEN